MRHFLRDDDLSPAEQSEVLDLARRMKADRHGIRPLDGPQGVAIIFDKPTLRTQLSFSVGIAELGGFPTVVDGNLAQIGVRESIADTARVLGRQVAAIVWRTHDQSRIEQMAAYAGVPVVNALTDQFHPCQILADLLTISEHKGALSGLTMTYLGDCANNMAHSYLLGGALAGMHVRLAGPSSHHPDAEIRSRAEYLARKAGGTITIGDSAAVSADGADVLITDTWVSMGQEAQGEERRGDASPFAAFALDEQLLAQASDDAIAMHCLPAYRGFEISEAVLEGPQSVVWDEAENRLHAQKALLAFLLSRRDGAQR